MYYQTNMENSRARQNVINELSLVEDALILYEEKCKKKIELLHEKLAHIQQNAVVLTPNDKIALTLQEQIDSTGFTPIADAVKTARNKLIDFETKYPKTSSLDIYRAYIADKLDSDKLSNIHVDDLKQWIIYINMLTACNKTVNPNDVNYYKQH